MTRTRLAKSKPKQSDPFASSNQYDGLFMRYNDMGMDSLLPIDRFLWAWVPYTCLPNSWLR
jgi:hypothetical protein